MTDRAEYIKGLRALADILERSPEVPLPYQGHTTAMTLYFFNSEDPRKAMATARRALGIELTKDVWGNYFDLAGALHGVQIKLTAYRADVCERVVVATREVKIEVPDPAAVAALPKVTRTEVIEDVEWVCHPILAEAPAEVTV
jgi:hypothetical protein